MKSHIEKLAKILSKGIDLLTFRGNHEKSAGPQRESIPVQRLQMPEKTSQAFRKAVAYAKKKLTDPGYQQVAHMNHTSAYNVAIADFLNPPVAYNIDAKDYDGLPGRVVFIEAADDFQVASVEVKILDGSNRLVEKGNAHHVKDFTWRYVTTAVNGNLPGSIILAVAYDKPGNSGFFALREDGTPAPLDAYNLLAP